MDRVCPLLALAADHRTAVDGVDSGHRCHAVVPPVPLERERQSRLCLSAAHGRCERYLAHLGRGASRLPGASTIGDGFRSTRLLVAPEPVWRGMAGRARPSTRGLAVVGAVIGVGLTGVAMVAAGVIGPSEEPPAAMTATGRPSAEPSSTATPRATVTPAPTASPAPTDTPPPSPTPAPATPPPTVAPTPQRTYVVQEGDTLAAIAQQFGVAVPTIQAANGIEDPNEIVIGDVLVIP